MLLFAYYIPIACLFCSKLIGEILIDVTNNYVFRVFVMSLTCHVQHKPVPQKECVFVVFDLLNCYVI